MPEGVSLDVAITWTGAAGCAWHLYSLRHASQSRSVAAVRFLLAVLLGLLLLRGFAWLSGAAWLGRVSLAMAAMLPLAVTLFVEHVLRRHHPLWLKVTALGATVVLFTMNLAAGPGDAGRLLLAFACTVTGVVLANALALWRYRQAGLGQGEERVAQALLLVGLLAAPLALTDFRTHTGLGSVRLGAIGALLFSYVMLGSVVHTHGSGEWAARFAGLLMAALAFSGLLALAAHGIEPGPWWTNTLGGWPLAYAALLLVAVYVTGRTTRSSSMESAFLGWLQGVPLRSRADFIAALSRAPDAATHVVLGQADLRGHDARILARVDHGGTPVASLDRMRMLVAARDTALAEAAEQWVDLLEGLQMTHGFVVALDPATVVLVRLPATTSPAAAEQRLAVVRHLFGAVTGE